MYNTLITPSSIVLSSEGKPYTIKSDNPNFNQVKDEVKILQNLITEKADKCNLDFQFEKIQNLINPSQKINSLGQGLITVRDGMVYYKEQIINNTIANHILWGMREGFSMTPHLRFFEKLMNNPSYRAVNELYGFIEKNNMAISEDGDLIAYKFVTQEFLDCHTRTFDNHPGQSHRMPRHEVNDNCTVTCSRGFHACAFSYLDKYAQGHQVVIVRIDPADVVSIPIDSNEAKLRVCAYSVIGLCENFKMSDVLAAKPIWAESEWTGNAEESVDSDDYDEDSEDDEDSEEEQSDKFDFLITEAIYHVKADQVVRIEIECSDGSQKTFENENDIKQIQNKIAQQVDVLRVKLKIKPEN